MKTPISALALAALLCACAPEQGDVPISDASAPAAPTAAVTPFAGPGADPSPRPAPTEARAVRYTRLDKCRVIESTTAEGGWYSAECPGPAGYALRHTEGDLRQNIVVVPPQGEETSLALSEATRRGGFSRLGETVEWRGTGEGEGFRPDALILRFFVIEDPEQPRQETSYLLPVSLGSDKPCVAAMVPPGAGQNERARRIADGAMKCLR